jgi:cell wall-associated NlpC family hydrolase
MNTATLWQQGRLIGGETVKANQLRPGDMCFYAYGTPLHAGNSEHVTIYIGNGKCISQGSDEGPLLLPYNESSKPFVGARRYQF